MKPIKEVKWKIANVTLVFFGLTAHLVSNWYWTNVCPVQHCEVVFLESFVAPIRVAGIALAIILTPFIFLPQHYFKAYLKNVFWWGFCVAFILVYSTDPNSSSVLSPSPERVAHNQSIVWGIMTVLYVAYHWWQTRHNHSSHFRWWFLLPLVLIFFISPYLFA